MSLGIGASLSSPWSPRSKVPLVNFPSPSIFSRAAKTFIEYLVHVSIHPLHNIWLHRYLGKASGDSPSLSLMQGWLFPCLLPLSLLTHSPSFVFFSELWLSEWRNMCVLQVLL